MLLGKKSLKKEIVLLSVPTKRFGSKESRFSKLWWKHSISSYFENLNNIKILKSFTHDPVWKSTHVGEWCRIQSFKILDWKILLLESIFFENFRFFKNVKSIFWLRSKLGKSSLRVYSLLFMTMICDIKIKDPLSIILGKGEKIFELFFLAKQFLKKETKLNSDHLKLNWDWPFASWYALAFPRSNNCPHKLLSTWNFKINYIQCETFTTITLDVNLSHKLHWMWKFHITYIPRKTFDWIIFAF